MAERWKTARGVLGGLVVLSLLGVGGRPAVAWTPPGHALIGALAERLLPERTRQQVAEILRVPVSEAAKWPDCVRSIVKQPDGTFIYKPAKEEYDLPCVTFKTPAELDFLADYARRNSAPCDGVKGPQCHVEFHYTDVDIARPYYSRAFAGTNDHDVVSAIKAAVLVLQGKLAPKPPFDIANRREALFLLAHFVGDIHQPIHVGVAYLGADGSLVDPDQPNPPAYANTMGGNWIKDLAGAKDLHTEWDEVVPALGAPSPDEFAALLTAARSVPRTKFGMVPATPDQMAQLWASDTLPLAREAFAGLTFAPDVTEPKKWVVQFADRDAYMAAKDRVQRAQVIKAAAHLAEILKALLP